MDVRKNKMIRWCTLDSVCSHGIFAIFTNGCVQKPWFWCIVFIYDQYPEKKSKYHGHIDNKVFLRYLQSQPSFCPFSQIWFVRCAFAHTVLTSKPPCFKAAGLVQGFAPGVGGKATFSFKASVCSGRRLLWLIQQPGRPHLIPFKTRLSESHMHIICMHHDALASWPPDAFFRPMNAILWLWRQARKTSTFTRCVSVPYAGTDRMDGRDSWVFL